VAVAVTALAIALDNFLLIPTHTIRITSQFFSSTMIFFESLVDRCEENA
jgi:hypothetical protein